ncbi:hypothetical protein WK22_10780 [Burkholderia multivorans]|uniref:hypothetical protein n=1 Tax=Burkholderia multivorans TaxID=87883 RepID=UPI000841B32C|nr:hypothetical protein [Burkholderia multivorans]AOJ93129.1 hypothetical protein WK22_09510 [Burkholderia multivorans]AOJ93356.1 hypothetical protein WK22_10780 [Burkholderia multivorans]
MTDPNHDIVPTLRMFDGVMTGLAADEIERLRKRVAELEADAEAEARLTDEQLARAAEQFNELLDAVELGSNSERKKARSAIHAFYRRALLNGADHDR